MRHFVWKSPRNRRQVFASIVLLTSTLSIYWYVYTQTDVILLDREIKARKQAFGIDIYDLMEELENDTALAQDDKETKIRAVFDAARKDIAVIRAKQDCKKEEMAVLDAEGDHTTTTESLIPPSSGAVVTNQHPSETS